VAPPPSAVFRPTEMARGVPELLLLWPKHSMQLPSWYVIFISFTFVLC
jgi:hypothetical protein